MLLLLGERGRLIPRYWPRSRKPTIHTLNILFNHWDSVVKRRSYWLSPLSANYFISFCSQSSCLRFHRTRDKHIPTKQRWSFLACLPHVLWNLRNAAQQYYVIKFWFENVHSQISFVVYIHSKYALRLTTVDFWGETDIPSVDILRNYIDRFIFRPSWQRQNVCYGRPPRYYNDNHTALCRGTARGDRTSPALVQQRGAHRNNTAYGLSVFPT